MRLSLFAAAHGNEVDVHTLRRCAPYMVLILAMQFVCSSAQASDVYRWKDANGTVHFGEHPPQGIAAEQLSTSTGKRATSQRPKNTTASTSPADSSVDASAEEKAAKAPVVATKPPKPKKDKGICKRARSNLKTLTERARIRQKDENGEESFMSEAQKDEQKKAAKDAIKDYC